MNRLQSSGGLAAADWAAGWGWVICWWPSGVVGTVPESVDFRTRRRGKISFFEFVRIHRSNDVLQDMNQTGFGGGTGGGGCIRMIDK